ncbi:hypothetical protein [Actinobacillus equuli]|uniref:hypothetical protein n=1 Tax=Actinobacillus equuli TaxID=718 RepID=UPI002441979C|nr:hypothetical protein [Actinobacillus equuli]WGE59476.1 hypothetical protein NYR73_01595 [Actinobacillus equuli subsp. haemolyticus]
MAFDTFNSWNLPISRNPQPVPYEPKPSGPVQYLKQFVIDDDQATLVLINRWVAPPSYRDRVIFDDISGGRLLRLITMVVIVKLTIQTIIVGYIVI